VTVSEAVFELPFSDAVTVAAWFAVTVPAVAVKLPVVAPAPTVTDVGTVSAVLLSDTATAVPPVGAACEIVTVQLELPPEAIEVGVQVSPETVDTVDWPTVMVPPVAVAPVETPPDETANALLTGIETDALLVDVSVTAITATTPLAIALAFIPVARQVKEPVPLAQFRLLPAALSAPPAVALIAATFDDE